MLLYGRAQACTNDVYTDSHGKYASCIVVCVETYTEEHIVVCVEMHTEEISIQSCSKFVGPKDNIQQRKTERQERFLAQRGVTEAQ